MAWIPGKPRDGVRQGVAFFGGSASGSGGATAQQASPSSSSAQTMSGGSGFFGPALAQALPYLFAGMGGQQSQGTPSMPQPSVASASSGMPNNFVPFGYGGSPLTGASMPTPSYSYLSAPAFNPAPPYVPPAPPPLPPPPPQSASAGVYSSANPTGNPALDPNSASFDPSFYSAVYGSW